MALYSIGHSNHPLDHFLGLLSQHAIEVLVDVRSVPASRYSPQFNQPLFERAVHREAVEYVYMGLG